MAERPVIVVTGANGFIGTHLVAHFASSGWDVRALVHGEPAERLPGVAYRRWALGDTAARGVLADAACVIHAAFVRYERASASELNLAGSVGLLSECRDAGVGRIVFLSSMSARRDALSRYGRDKFLVQESLAGPRELAIRPGLVLGDGGLFRTLRRYVERGPIVPLIGGGGQLIQTIHVDDLAAAIEAGVRLGLCGTVTIGEVEPVAFREILAETARLLRVRRAFVPVPYRAGEIALRIAGSLPGRSPLTRDNLLGLRGSTTQDVRPDLERLGIVVRDYRASLRAILAGDGPPGVDADRGGDAR